VVINEEFKFRRQFTGWRGVGGSWNYSVRFSDENYSQILNMRLLGLIIALGTPIAFLFFGLSMLLIEVVGRLWPTNSKAR